MFWTIERLTRRLALALSCAGFGLCLAASAGAESPHAENRHEDRHESRQWVLQNAEQVQDLYLDGQLEDRDGRLWDVGIVPGARVTLQEAGAEFAEGGDRWLRAGREIAAYGTVDFWVEQTRPIREGLQFAGDAAAFGYEGVPSVLGDTRDEVGTLLSEKPFAWGPRALWRGSRGVLVEAPVIATLGTLGTVAGVGFAATAPVVTSARPAVTAGGHMARGLFVDGLLEGVVVPAGKLAWHQPAFALAVLGPEPTPPQDGQFGLRIVSEKPLTYVPQP